MKAKNSSMTSLVALLVALSHATIPKATAFVMLQPLTTRTIISRSSSIKETIRLSPASLATRPTNTRTSVTALHAFLPPSDDRNKGGLGPLVSSFLTLGLTVAFFLSPLGAIVLGLFNSLLLLSILTPVLFIAGFNLWQFFNTIAAPCPSCGAPATVMKRQQTGVNAMVSNPTLCMNCGAVLAASEDNNDIAVVSGGISDRTNTGFFDSLFSRPSRTQGPEITVTKRDENAKRFRREQTVIDVDVED